MNEEILRKYNMAPLAEYKEAFGDDSEKSYYETFLIQTDHVVNKIIEKLIEDLATASVTTLAGTFIAFLAAVRTEYKEILTCRKYAREKVQELEKLTHSDE